MIKIWVTFGASVVVFIATYLLAKNNQGRPSEIGNGSSSRRQHLTIWMVGGSVILLLTQLSVAFAVQEFLK